MGNLKILQLAMPVLMIFLVACASRPPVTPAARSSEGSSNPSSLPAGQSGAWQTEWQSLTESARKEGKVVVYSTVGGAFQTVIASAFNKKYGITVETVVAGGAQMSEKIMRERKAGLYLSDVFVSGADTPVTVLKPANILVPLKPLLILPEVTDTSVWYGGKPHWVDLEGIYTISLLAFPTSAVVYNRNLVKSGDIKSWFDLLDPKWKDKIVMGDPTTSGVTAGVFTGLVDIVGLDWMRGLAKQEPVFIRDQRLQVEWIVHGKYPVTVAPKTALVTEFVNVGSPLELLVPVEGTNVTAGSGNISFMSKAPHSNAARVFINWLLTREGATIFSQALGDQSARLDVTTEGLDPLRLRQPNMKYNWYDDEALLVKGLERKAMFKEIFGAIVK